VWTPLNRTEKSGKKETATQTKRDYQEIVA